MNDECVKTDSFIHMGDEEKLLYNQYETASFQIENSIELTRLSEFEKVAFWGTPCITDINCSHKRTEKRTVVTMAFNILTLICSV